MLFFLIFLRKKQPTTTYLSDNEGRRLRWSGPCGCGGSKLPFNFILFQLWTSLLNCLWLFKELFFLFLTEIFNQMSQRQFMDYKLNSSFLPHCLLPENDTSRVFAWLFWFYLNFLSFSLKTFAQNEECVSVHSKGFIFDEGFWLKVGPVCGANWCEWTWVCICLGFFSSLSFSLSCPLFYWSPVLPPTLSLSLWIWWYVDSKYIIFILIHMEVTLLAVAHRHPTSLFDVNSSSSSTSFSLWKQKAVLNHTAIIPVCLSLPNLGFQ